MNRKINVLRPGSQQLKWEKRKAPRKGCWTYSREWKWLTQHWMALPTGFDVRRSGGILGCKTLEGFSPCQTSCTQPLERCTNKPLWVRPGIVPCYVCVPWCPIPRLDTRGQTCAWPPARMCLIHEILKRTFGPATAWTNEPKHLQSSGAQELTFVTSGYYKPQAHASLLSPSHLLPLNPPSLQPLIFHYYLPSISYPSISPACNPFSFPFSPLLSDTGTSYLFPQRCCQTLHHSPGI